VSVPVIRVQGLGKRYRVGGPAQRPGHLREALMDMVASPFRRLAGRGGPRGAQGEFWALRDVSFDVEQGEVLGIIGRNGAGKSTALKIISRITPPTAGRVELHGRVGSLLEVGTGFHGDLTGRENVYLNGTILGMRRAEIDRKFDEIMAFAGVEAFIDTPVKRYSSGMYMRLAFAVAAHLDTEILLVDEVLAVGDMEFQKKCLGKMDEVARSGRTVLFVSHNMAAIRRLCGRGILLERGTVAAIGPMEAVADLYVQPGEHGEGARFDPRDRRGTGWARVTDVRIVDEHEEPVAARPCDADLLVEVTIEVADEAAAGTSLRGLIVELVVRSHDGEALLSLMNVDDTGVALPDARACRVLVRLPGPTFVPGRYGIDVFVGIPFLQHVDEISGALVFDVLPPVEPWRPYELHQSRGLLCRKAEWSCADVMSRAATAAREVP
jgi:lipopolysaccharide transport system ATP-binding protein